MHLPVCKVAISLRRDVAATEPFSSENEAARSEMIAKRTVRHSENSWCVVRSAIVTTERDGYFPAPQQTARCTRPDPPSSVGGRTAGTASLTLPCEPICYLGQRIEGQAAEQLWIEVGALGRHSFFVQADRFDVSQRRGHDQAASV